MRRVYNVSTGETEELDDLVVTPVVLTKQEAVDAINNAAGDAAIRTESTLIAKGYGRKDEYNNAAKAVKDWREAGSPAGDVPEDITAWAIPKGYTNEQAAQDLEAQEAFLRSRITAIRKLRLAGTVEVGDAVADWETVAQPHINALNAYDPMA